MNEIVTLRTGKVVPESVVKTTTIGLLGLLQTHPMAVYELVQACRDKQHVMFGRTGTAALEMGLIEGLSFDGRADIHDAVRDIVLASVVGEEVDLALQEPVAGGDS